MNSLAYARIGLITLESISKGSRPAQTVSLNDQFCLPTIDATGVNTTWTSQNIVKGFLSTVAKPMFLVLAP